MPIKWILPFNEENQKYPDYFIFYSSGTNLFALWKIDRIQIYVPENKKNSISFFF